MIGCRKPIYSPNQIALDETVIRINNEQFWLYAAADTATNELLHVRLFATTTTAPQKFSSANFGKSTMSKPPCFWLMALNSTNACVGL